MTPGKGKEFRTSVEVTPKGEAAGLALAHAYAAGIDVHSDVHFVSVPPADVPEGFVNPERNLPAGVVTGLTGMKIIKDIVRGVRDPYRLAKHRHERCKATEAEIAAALCGTWREEHLFALKQALELYEFYLERMRECDASIESCLRRFADKSGDQKLPPRPRKRQRRAKGHTFGARELLFRMAGIDVTMIEGIDEATALVILSEIGVDVSRFPTEKHFTSWLGLSPQHRGSNQRILKRGVRKGANRAARAFRMAAQGCYKAKNALGAFYRRIRAHRGAPKALVATARKIAERFYRLLKHGHEYVRQAEAAYEQAYQLRKVKSLARQAKSLGYTLSPAAAN